MKTFKDTNGIEWSLSVNIGTIQDVRDTLNFDILESGDVLQKIGSDMVLLVNTIYVICKDQADKRSITDREFGRAMAGDAIEMASKAFTDDYIDFFPTARRKILRGLADKIQELDVVMLRQGQEMVDNLSVADLEKMIAGNLSTTAQE